MRQRYLQKKRLDSLSVLLQLSVSTRGEEEERKPRRQVRLFKLANNTAQTGSR